MSNHCHPDLHCTLPCFAPLCVASQSNRICTRRMPSAERRLRRLPRLRLASLHAGDRAFCAVIACQCSAVQQIAVQCLPIRFAIAFFLCKARPESQTLLPIGASSKACADSRKGSDRQLARADATKCRQRARAWVGSTDPNAEHTIAENAGVRSGRPRRQSRDCREMRLSRSDQVARSRRLSPEGAARGRGRTREPTALSGLGARLGRYCPHTDKHSRWQWSKKSKRS